jgi:putative FmdB family regulatory protein
MPIFEYVCRECNQRFEALVYGTQKPECPRCGGRKLETQLSVFAVSSKSSSASETAPAATRAARAHVPFPIWISAVWRRCLQVAALPGFAAGYRRNSAAITRVIWRCPAGTLPFFPQHSPQTSAVSPRNTGTYGPSSGTTGNSRSSSSGVGH